MRRVFIWLVVATAVAAGAEGSRRIVNWQSHVKNDVFAAAISDWNDRLQAQGRAELGTLHTLGARLHAGMRPKDVCAILDLFPAADYTAEPPMRLRPSEPLVGARHVVIWDLTPNVRPGGEAGLAWWLAAYFDLTEQDVAPDQISNRDWFQRAAERQRSADNRIAEMRRSALAGTPSDTTALMMAALEDPRLSLIGYEVASSADVREHRDDTTSLVTEPVYRELSGGRRVPLSKRWSDPFSTDGDVVFFR